MTHLSTSEQEQLNDHIQAIAEILYPHSEPETLETFETIELKVREHLLEQVGPGILKNFYRSRARERRVVCGK